MKTRKMLKLVNNERINRKIESGKACDSTSIDICALENYDLAECTLGAYDLCVKDFVGCKGDKMDYCGPNGYDMINECSQTDYY